MKEQSKIQFQSMTMLEALINHYKAYAGDLKGHDKALEPVFAELERVGLVNLVKDRNVYIPTEQGISSVQRFLNRKKEASNMLDVYSAVDIETGEFAWEQTIEALKSEDVVEFLAEARWRDLRLAVAEFKKMNVEEVAFMICFRNYTAFDIQGVDAPGDWQKSLMGPKIWDGVESMLNLEMGISDLDYEDWEGKISGKEVVSAIIKSGAQIMLGSGSESASRNYLKASYVDPCWSVDLRSGKQSNGAQKGYW